MDKEREAPLTKGQRELEKFGIKFPEEAEVPLKVKSFLQKVEEEPEIKAGEQPAAASLPPTPPAAGIQEADIDITPKKLHRLLRYHAGNAARWLGEQVRRILKIRLRRGEVGR